MPPTLGYWEMRGLAHPIRLLLHYVGVEFEDKRYTVEGYEEWFNQDKINLATKLDFPNIPYYIDSDVHLTQSKAILLYLARKHKLDGGNEKEKARLGVIFFELSDIRQELANLVYPPDISNRQELHDLLLKHYLESLKCRFESIAKVLGDNTWLNGNSLSYVDFYLYDVLDVHRLLFHADRINKFPTLLAYMKRMENLAGVKEFLGSAAFKPLPIFGPMAIIANTEHHIPL